MKSVAELIHLVQRLAAQDPQGKYAFAIVTRSEAAGDKLYDDASCQLLIGQAGLYWTDQLVPYHVYLYGDGNAASLTPTRKLAFVMGLPADIEALKKDYPVALHGFYRDLHESANVLGVMVDDLIVSHHA